MFQSRDGSPPLFLLLPASDVLPRLTFGSITANLLVANMEAEPITHIFTGTISDWAIVRIESLSPFCSTSLFFATG